MSNYRQHFNRRETPQTQAIPGEKMVQNNAGGFTFAVDKWVQLERFLILGSENNTYYVSAQKLTIENAENVLECVNTDGIRTVKTIAEISNAGRAPKNDPALFALAICAGMGDEATRRAAFEALPVVARIGTHILMFANFMEGFRGWGRAAKRGVGSWFTQMPAERLAYQFLKYAQRDGWSMRDLLRLTHPQASSDEQNALFRYIVRGEVSASLPEQVRVVHGLNEETPKKKLIDSILKYRLTREMIPNSFLKDPEVWEALLPGMPMTAMIRNLGNMGKSGLLKPMSAASKLVGERLVDEDALSRARIHPINILAALVTYQQGKGILGKNTWEAVPQVVDALNSAFYKSFKYVEPTGKNILLGLDVSGSMFWTPANGMNYLMAGTAAAALSMATVRTEKNWHVMGFSHKFTPLSITPGQRLDTVVRTMKNVKMGGTDCALPMVWALENKVEVDAFIVYTDNETWAGRVHPVQALRKYRDAMGRPAKLIVSAMSSTHFSIADPKDAGMMDVAGLDSSVPAIISDFIRN